MTMGFDEAPTTKQIRYMDALLGLEERRALDAVVFNRYDLPSFADVPLNKKLVSVIIDWAKGEVGDGLLIWALDKSMGKKEG